MYEDLYEENKGLLMKQVRRYAYLCEMDRAVSVEDLVQSGFLGLIRAKETFDESRRVGWANYARWCIIKEMQRALHIDKDGNAGIDAHAVSLDTPVLSDDPDGDAMGDLIADDSLPASDEILLRAEIQSTIQKAVNGLADPRQRQVVLLHTFQGKTFAEAGDIIGVTAGRAAQMYNRAQSNLARNSEVRALVDLDDHTRFHAHKGVRRFMADWTSVTEEAALWRIQQRQRAKKT